MDYYRIIDLYHPHYLEQRLEDATNALAPLQPGDKIMIRPSRQETVEYILYLLTESSMKIPDKLFNFYTYPDTVMVECLY